MSYNESNFVSLGVSVIKKKGPISVSAHVVAI